MVIELSFGMEGLKPGVLLGIKACGLSYYVFIVSLIIRLCITPDNLTSRGYLAFTSKILVGGTVAIKSKHLKAENLNLTS